MDYVFPFNPGHKLLFAISGDLFNSAMQKYRNKIFIRLESNPMEILYKRAVFLLTFFNVFYCKFPFRNIFNYSDGSVYLSFVIF